MLPPSASFGSRSSNHRRSSSNLAYFPACGASFLFATIRCPVGGLAPGRPFLCVVKEFHAHRKPTRQKRSCDAQDADEDPCAPRRASEARRLHPRVHPYAEEAEFGTSEGRARSPDERDGGHHLHSR